MKLPRSLKILNLTFALEEGSPEVMDATGDDGWCDFKRQKIVYDGRLEPDGLREVVLHEVIHAILRQLQLHPQVPDSEAIAHRLTVGLLSVLADNKAFKEWLFFS